MRLAAWVSGQAVNAIHLPSSEIAGSAAAGAAADPAISDDGKWMAFTAWPLTQAAKRMKTQRRPIQSKVVLVELATGKKSEFEKTRRFAFNGEMSTVIALYRY